MKKVRRLSRKTSGKTGMESLLQRAKPKHKKKRSKKRNNARSESLARRRKQTFVKIQKYGIVALLVVLTGGLIFIAVRGVLNIKIWDSSDQKKTDNIGSGDVVGFENIPTFPGSEFMFEKTKDHHSVKDFISSGKSAYLMPIDSTWDEVIEFYEKELKDLGWEHVLSVNIGDDERMPGEYWVYYDKVEAEEQETFGVLEESVDSNENNEETTDSEQPQTGKGLRIYTKLSDIWYELISIEDAKTGLASRVAKEKQLDLIISMSSSQEITAQFPWKLSFSSEWSYERRQANFLEMDMLEFTKNDNSTTLVIEPVDFYTMESLEKMGKDYIRDVNTHRDPENKLRINSTEEIKVDGEDAVKFSLESTDHTGALCLTPNSKNGVVYVIASYFGDLSFFEYVVGNIKAR